MVLVLYCLKGLKFMHLLMGHMREQQAIFYVKRNTVYTPPLTQNILPGITRQAVIDICSENRIRVRQKKIHYRNIINADEVFKTSSIAGIVPVKKIDRFMLAGEVPGKITARLMELYLSRVEPSNLH